MKGAREALEPLFGLPADFRLAWVFIDMMPSDTADSAIAASGRVDDARLSAFHDPGHVVGRAMARTLGWQHHVAWDTYFIYPPGARWEGDDIPAPALWFHQLQDREIWERVAEAEVGSSDWTSALAEKSEADPARFRTGDGLADALRLAVTSADLQKDR